MLCPASCHRTVIVFNEFRTDHVKANGAYDTGLFRPLVAGFERESGLAMPDPATIRFEVVRREARVIVSAIWPSGEQETVSEFESEGAALQWIKHESRQWLFDQFGRRRISK